MPLEPVAFSPWSYTSTKYHKPSRTGLVTYQLNKADDNDVLNKLIRHHLPRSYPFSFIPHHFTLRHQGTIFTISGIFFMYYFLVRDPGNSCFRAYVPIKK